MLTRAAPADFALGVSDLKAIEWTLNRKWDVRVAPHVHAKACVADDTDAVVTSANLTDAGLDSNLEIGVRVRGATVRSLVGKLEEWFARAEVKLTAREFADLRDRVEKLAGAAEREGQPFSDEDRRGLGARFSIAQSRPASAGRRTDRSEHRYVSPVALPFKPPPTTWSEVEEGIRRWVRKNASARARGTPASEDAIVEFITISIRDFPHELAEEARFGLLGGAMTLTCRHIAPSMIAARGQRVGHRRGRVAWVLVDEDWDTSNEKVLKRRVPVGWRVREWHELPELLLDENGWRSWGRACAALPAFPSMGSSKDHEKWKVSDLKAILPRE